jgi:protease-4
MQLAKRIIIASAKNYTNVMLSFLKYVFATIVALFLFFFLLMLLLAGIASMSGTEEVKVKDNSVLKISLDKQVQERASDDPFSELELPGLEEAGNIGLIELKKTIAKAKDDDKIKGIYLELSSTKAGFASLEEIRNALLDFKKSKKFIIAYGEYFTEGAYYIASVADEIVLNPMGVIEFNGLYSEIPFVKGTLSKLEVEPEIFRVGEYKSAVEPFILDKMSDANRVQTSSFLNSIYSHYLQAVSKTRNIPLERLKVISDSMLVRNAELAVEHNLATKVGYYDEVLDMIKTKLKLKEDEEVNFISDKKYEKAPDPKSEDKKLAENKIAVIIASGEIQGGKGNEDEVIGSDKIAEEIRKAREDKKVKAIVLRINSPGGSALASDVMWREIQLAKKVKPIVASMSDVAASGGYYMAMGCSKIVAHPTTITGSIGVFGLVFNAKGLLNNKLGVTVDGVKTGTFSDIATMTRAHNAAEKAIIQKEVNHIYDVFTSKAAEGRGMSQDDLKKVASGRVWSGAEAKEINLIDEFGGLDEAVKLAAKLANLGENDYRLRYLPAKKNFFESLLAQLSEEAETRMAKAYLGEHFELVHRVKHLKKLEGVQARLPFDIVIQ